jgi:isopenicillin N synthase-like dioxygenase
MLDLFRKLRSAHNENKENKEGKNMSATETKKATAGTSETIAELFHEAMRSY